MKRLLFRATRGKAIFQTFPLEIEEADVLRNDDFHTRRLGYIVIFEEGSLIRRVVTRVCESFIGPVFETSFSQAMQELSIARAQKEQLRSLIMESKQNFVDYLNRYNPLRGMESLSIIQVYKQFLIKEKTVYKTLNMFKNCNSLLVGLVWVPSKYETDFFTARNHMSATKNLNPHISSRSVDEELTRPTYFENNEFTGVF